MSTLLEMDIDDIIKGRIDTAYAEQDGRCCRSCKFFIRVRRNGDFKRIRRQGFCILGELCGDFGLYISSSIAGECKAFVLDEYNHTTTKKEDVLLTKWNDFRYKMSDKRTKEYKQIKGVIGAMDEYLDLYRLSLLDKYTLGLHHKAVGFAYDVFVKLNRKKYKEIFDRKAMRIKKYRRILGTITKVFESFIDGGMSKNDI